MFSFVFFLSCAYHIFQAWKCTPCWFLFCFVFLLKPTSLINLLFFSFYILFKHILNHTKFFQSILIHLSVSIGMHVHLYIFFTVLVFVCFIFRTVLIWFPGIVFQHFSKSDKQGWLTRWPPGLSPILRHSTSTTLFALISYAMIIFLFAL